ncbi:MAG: acyltransferase [Bryocella sp.]
MRFAAACLVYIYHSNQRRLVTEVLPASNFGHSSVIVFFVLSGFVIAYVTDTKERDWVRYSASRLSRIYSVALPAVVLTVVLDAVGRQLYPALYDYPFDHFALRIASSLLMLNETWFVSITSFSNVPYWSIGYEVWYYVAFAIATFAPRRVVWALLCGLALVLGPKVVLLAPIWIAGVVLYHWTILRSLSPTISWALVIFSVFGITLFHAADVAGVISAHLKGWIGGSWQRELTFSQYFLSDYLLAGLVFLNFAGMRGAARTIEAGLLKFERPIRFLAGFTLTLYLLHHPLFLFWGAVIRGDPAGRGYWWLVTLATAGSVLLIGHFTESKRHVLRSWLELRLRKLETAWVARRYVVGS